MLLVLIAWLMSALPPKADIVSPSPDVRFVPKADILRCGKKTPLFDYLVGAHSKQGVAVMEHKRLKTKVAPELEWRVMCAWNGCNSHGPQDPLAAGWTDFVIYQPGKRTRGCHLCPEHTRAFEALLKGAEAVPPVWYCMD